jgi:hypothetical protein
MTHAINLTGQFAEVNVCPTVNEIVLFPHCPDAGAQHISAEGGWLQTAHPERKDLIVEPVPVRSRNGEPALAEVTAWEADEAQACCAWAGGYFCRWVTSILCKVLVLACVIE